MFRALVSIDFRKQHQFICIWADKWVFKIFSVSLLSGLLSHSLLLAFCCFILQVFQYWLPKPWAFSSPTLRGCPPRVRWKIRHFKRYTINSFLSTVHVGDVTPLQFLFFFFFFLRRSFFVLFNGIYIYIYIFFFFYWCFVQLYMFYNIIYKSPNISYKYITISIHTQIILIYIDL